ncbi:hypothetical protein [Actibacterium lipolyticum]|uniref:Uncharacterized protein n=1 Tax=Actibacterium lipolyticum TaxID=1524263 RepID=A0A238KMA6_9RHOB|nr:hypothetical protein [Actibacterium lipolyticum]SMX43242.1 hypothetical protein COL8621_02251 [Actibacterium lipolyticum]
MPSDTSIPQPLEAPLPKVLNSKLAFTFFLVIAAIVLWGLSFATWGVPGLYLPAVAAVPVIFALLLLITRG